MHHLVRVVDPGHGPGVGVDVRRGDVRVRADVVAEIRDEASGDALELGLGDAALVEFGDMLDTAKVITGYPKELKDASYIDKTYEEYYLKAPHDSLDK